MTKQEEIREILEGIGSGGLSVDEGLRELDIVGVVIKVDREDIVLNEEYYMRRNIPLPIVAAVEPLIKEVSNGYD